MQSFPAPCCAVVADALCLRPPPAPLPDAQGQDDTVASAALGQVEVKLKDPGHGEYAGTLVAGGMEINGDTDYKPFATDTIGGAGADWVAHLVHAGDDGVAFGVFVEGMLNPNTAMHNTDAGVWMVWGGGRSCYGNEGQVETGRKTGPEEFPSGPSAFQLIKRGNNVCFRWGDDGKVEQALSIPSQHAGKCTGLALGTYSSSASIKLIKVEITKAGCAKVRRRDICRSWRWLRMQRCTTPSHRSIVGCSCARCTLRPSASRW